MFNLLELKMPPPHDILQAVGEFLSNTPPSDHPTNQVQR